MTQHISQQSLWDYAHSEGIGDGFWDQIGCHSPLLTALSFPRSRPPAGEKIERRNGYQAMIITPGDRMVDDRIVEMCAPWGIIPRKLLPWIISTVRQQWEDGLGDDAAVVRLGSSRSDMLSRLGLSTGGKNYANLIEQLEALTSARIVVLSVQSMPDVTEETRIDLSMSIRSTMTRRGGHSPGWDMTLEVGPNFFDSIINRVVPLDMRAVQRWATISNKTEANCWTVDLGVWLAHRLRSLNKSGKSKQFIGVEQLRAQFGPGHSRDDRYLATIHEALMRIIESGVWPNLVIPRIDDRARGITLFPSGLLVPDPRSRY